MAPPFDVIGPDRQEQLYRKSPYNIVRIIKGRTKPSDNSQENQYTRAAQYLNDWTKDGVLKQDRKEAIYGYVQDFELMGMALQRVNFIALAKLEDFGEIVRPHEQILDAPMIDRLKLKKATGARFGLVFMLYEDKENVAERAIESSAAREPLIDFVNDDNVRHRLFAITPKENIKTITQMMSDKSCIIADGHHRYTTGLNYYKQSSDPAARYQMLAFTNVCQDGLRILATHRLVGNLDNFDAPGFLAQLRKSFEVTEYPFGATETKAEAENKMLAQLRAKHDDNENAFGIYAGNSCFYVAVLKDKHAMGSAAPEKSPAWRALDAAVLQKLVLEKVLRIDQEKLTKGKNVQYVKDAPDAIDASLARIDAGEQQVVFFMNPVKMQQLKMVTDEGERMPPKSTYFYPKMYTGLTIQEL
jgi:uncharacterized protein (DUF1015 family)